MNTYGPLFDNKLSGVGLTRLARAVEAERCQDQAEPRNTALPSTTGQQLKEKGIKEVSEHNDNWMYHANDSNTGQQLKEKGIKEVSEHNDNWMYHAFRSALCFVMTSKSDFTGEDIRFHCFLHAGDPTTPHAWGALINTLIKRKIIVPTGEHRKMKDSRSHARSTPVYKAL